MPNTVKLWVCKLCKCCWRITRKELLQLLTVAQIKLSNRGHYVPAPLLLDNDPYQVSDRPYCWLCTCGIKGVNDKESRGSSGPVCQNLCEVMIDAQLLAEFSKAVCIEVVNCQENNVPSLIP